MRKKSDLSPEALVKDEITNRQILEAIQGLDQKVGGLDQNFQFLDQKVGGFDKKFLSLDQKFGGLNTKLLSLDQKVDKNAKLIQENRKLIDNNRQLINHNKEEILEVMNQFSTEMEERFDFTDRRFSNLEFHQEEILLKLDNKVSKSEFIGLEKRVSALENK